MSSQPKEEYDPHKHRNRPHPTTNLETLVHLLKGAIGTGILAMPLAFRNSGWVLGIILTIVVTSLCVLGVQTLISSMYVLCKRKQVPSMPYPVAMKLAAEEGPPSLRWLGPISRVAVDGLLILYQLGIIAIYVIFVSVNIKQLIEQETDFRADDRVHMLFYFIPFLLIMCVPNLKYLAPFSTVANLLVLIGLGLVAYYVFTDFPSIADRSPVNDVVGIPLFIGTCLFALESIGVIIAVEANMEHPESFIGTYGIFNISMLIVMILYGAVGLLGYIKYGEDVLGSLTLNIPVDEKLSQSAKCLFCIAVFISYALQGFVPVEILWESYFIHRFGESSLSAYWPYFIRFAVVIISYVFAMAIPNLGLFISLLGAFCLSMLGFSFPALMEICVSWPDNFGPYNYVLWKNIFLCIVGIFFWAVGTGVAIYELFQKTRYRRDQRAGNFANEQSYL